MMHGHEKSDSAIVAVKPTNKAEKTSGGNITGVTYVQDMLAGKSVHSVSLAS
jgi:hypothetical protein